MPKRLEFKRVILFLIVLATALVFGILVTNRPQASLYQITTHRITGADITTENITRLNFIEVPFVENPQNKSTVNEFNNYIKDVWLNDWILRVIDAEDELVQGVLDIIRLDDTTYLLKETLATRAGNDQQQTILHHRLLLLDGFDLTILNSVAYAQNKGIQATQIMNSIQQYLDHFQRSDSFITIPALSEESLENLSFYVTSNTVHIVLNTTTILENEAIISAPQLHQIPLIRN